MHTYIHTYTHMYINTGNTRMPESPDQVHAAPQQNNDDKISSSVPAHVPATQPEDRGPTELSQVKAPPGKLSPLQGDTASRAVDVDDADAMAKRMLALKERCVDHVLQAAGGWRKGVWIMSASVRLFVCRFMMYESMMLFVGSQAHAGSKVWYACVHQRDSMCVCVCV
jgi:hypothetical protein